MSRCTSEDGLDKITIAGPADQIGVIWASIDVIASPVLDDAVEGARHSRSAVCSEHGGIAAMRFDALDQMAERVIAAHTDCLDSGAGMYGEITLDGRRIAPEVAKRWVCNITSSVILEHKGHVHDEGNKTLNRRLRRALHRPSKGMCR